MFAGLLPRARERPRMRRVAAHACTHMEGIDTYSMCPWEHAWQVEDAAWPDVNDDIFLDTVKVSLRVVGPWTRLHGMHHRRLRLDRSRKLANSLLRQGRRGGAIRRRRPRNRPRCSLIACRSTSHDTRRSTRRLVGGVVRI